MARIRVLMVCLGNICRSPMAQGVLEARLREAGLDTTVEVDSAGTYGYHIGEPPDPRAQAAARQRGYHIADQCARRLGVEDFHAFDYILVMDNDNLKNARALQPPNARAQLHRLLEFSRSRTAQEVPDPYHGGSHGFIRVLELVEDATEGFLVHLRAQHRL
jgi:protein-tyrosine phosphatase